MMAFGCQKRHLKGGGIGSGLDGQGVWRRKVEVVEIEKVKEDVEEEEKERPQLWGFYMEQWAGACTQVTGCLLGSQE